MHAGCWTKKSTAFDHYLHTDLALLPPQKIFDSMPKCHRVITTAHLKYLNNNIIQAPGNKATNPHHLVLNKEYPVHLEAIKNKIPEFYPGKQCKIRDSMERIARRNKIYLRVQAQARMNADLEFLRRSAIAKAIRQVNTNGAEAVCREVEAISVVHINDQMVIEHSVQVNMPTSSQTTQMSPAKNADLGIQIKPASKVVRHPSVSI